MTVRLAKGWKRSANSKLRDRREQGALEELPSILIVCEGKKTEPQYFESFRVPTLRLSKLNIVPSGSIHISVVERAVEESKKGNPYDQIWCVFDRDKNIKNPKDAEQFNKAIALAKEKKFKIAYSNDAFELWYLLHFIYFDTQITRADYIKKLNTRLKGGYKKNDPDIFSKLEDKMDEAIKRAEKRLKELANVKPVDADPSTTVHLLVKELKKHSR